MPKNAYHRGAPRRENRSRSLPDVRHTSRVALRIIRAQADEDMLSVGAFFSPVTRGDCERVPRPCPFVSCRWNLYLDVSRRGTVKVNFPDLEPGEMPADASCALDIADAGGATLEQVGAVLNMTRERVRQIEQEAKAKLGPALVAYAEGDYLDELRSPRALRVLAAEAPELGDLLDVGFEASTDRGKAVWE